MRSAAMLESFVSFCNAHPEYRFWQALNAWSGYGTIWGQTKGDVFMVRDALKESGANLIDTFYLEGRRHDDNEPDPRPGRRARGGDDEQAGDVEHD